MVLVETGDHVAAFQANAGAVALFDNPFRSVCRIRNFKRIGGLQVWSIGITVWLDSHEPSFDGGREGCSPATIARVDGDSYIDDVLSGTTEIAEFAELCRNA